MEKEKSIIEFVKDEEIKNITTYKTLGKVKGVFYPKTQKELTFIYKYLKNSKTPFKVIGNGSNLLISDKSEKVFISTKKMKNDCKIKDGFLYVGAGCPLALVHRYIASRGYGGFEALATIPASIGGALKMNASAFGHSIFDNLEYIKILSNERLIKLSKDKITYSHHSTNLNNILIISAKFKLKPEKYCEINRNFTNYLLKRIKNQPKGLCCGSVFKNPQTSFAGKLIEECGLKGLEYNDAQISPVHANFIINIGQASFDDIMQLIKLCQEKVYQNSKIKLETEVEIID